MKELTKRQNEVFQYIKNSINEFGYPPTVREIGDNFNITVKGAYDHLKAVEKKGYIKTFENKSRAIVIVEDKESKIEENGLKIPLVGRIAAGAPILAEENIEDYLTFPKNMFKSAQYFAVTVHGDSMVEGGIYDGDIAVIKQQNHAENGEIVAALIDESATLKKIKFENDGIYLEPQNAAYSKFKVENVEIMGVLTNLFRTY